MKAKVGDSTIIIVAQRINTIIDAEQIVVMDEGKVAGIGTHDQLMECCDVYREIAAVAAQRRRTGKGGVNNGGKEKRGRRARAVMERT